MRSTPLEHDPRFKHHKHEAVYRFGSLTVRWSVVSVRGAIHFDAHISADGRYDTFAGLEIHRTTGPGDTAPDHLECPFVGGPCWHDGTSLYACESWEQQLRHDWEQGDHHAIWRWLQAEAQERGLCDPITTQEEAK